MVLYCPNSRGVKVLFSFDGGKQQVFEHNQGGVDIVTRTVPKAEFTGGQCLVNYTVNYRIKAPDSACIPASNWSYGTTSVVGEIRGTKIILNKTGEGVGEVNFGIVTSTGIKSLGGSSGGICLKREAYLFEIVSVNRVDNQSDNCGNTKTICEVLITKNGRQLLKIQGICPLEISTWCDDCPDNTHKCLTPGYPGYCCLSCADVSQKLLNMSR